MASPTRLACFVGTHPTYIKMWPIVRALRARPHEFAVSVIGSGQHYTMLKLHREVLPMTIDGWLYEGQLNLPLPRLYSYLYDRAYEWLDANPVDYVVVGGNTPTALAVGMAAFHRGDRVIHLESGLRTQAHNEPWPEEHNRLCLDGLADVLICPNARCAEQARAVNPSGKLLISGNTGLDSLRYVLGSAHYQALELESVLPEAAQQPYLLIEMHRRETLTDGTMQALVEGIIKAAAEHQILAVWPVHHNSRVMALAQNLQSPHFKMLPAQDYASFVKLQEHAQIIVTDSGGIIEEAIQLGVPSVRICNSTDRDLAVHDFLSVVATRHPSMVYATVSSLLRHRELCRQYLQGKPHPYGDGHAGERIAAFLAQEARD